MNDTYLFVKNMVCSRCIKVVKEVIEGFGLVVKDIKLGEVAVEGPLDEPKLLCVKEKLHEEGFELLDDKKAKIVEKIKTVIIKLIHQTDPISLGSNYSSQIAEKVGLDYNYLSTLFSSKESVTIEKYIILQKIERVKELLVYNELTLSEIAYKLGYSSVQHLSSQFKKITGLTPRYFKEIKEDKRKALDQVK